MGLMAFLPELTVYVGDRFKITDPTELTFWGGLIYGIAPFSAAIAGPVWGALGDRRGKKPMAIRANVAIGLTTALMPFASTPLLLLLLRAVMGVLAGYVAPAMSLAAAEVPPERHGRTIASLQVAMAMGSFLGPQLGAEVSFLVVAHLPAGAEPWWGRASLFWITSLLSLIAALLLWWLAHEEPRRPAAGDLSFVRELFASSAQLLHNRVFAWLLALVLCLRLGQNMLEPFIALFVRELGPQPWIASLTGNPEQALSRTTSLAFSVLAVSQWVFTPMWGRLADRFGPLRCLGIIGLLLGSIQLATRFTASIDHFLLLRCLAASAMAGSMTLAYAAASKRVVAARRTLAFAMVQSCMQLGFGCGGYFGSLIASIGATAEHANLRLPFTVAGGLCIAAGVGMLLLRRLPAGRDDGARPAVAAEP
jgi:DHA1 family multidrug resistance protein-like MFS transporter